MKKISGTFPCTLTNDVPVKSHAFAFDVQQFLAESTFLYRDTDLDPKTRQLYQTARLFRDPNLLVATNKFGGLNGNTRFLIVTTQMREIANLAEHIDWGLCVLERNGLFKIIDHQSDAEFHQITLIHIPHELDHYFRSQESSQLEIQLIAATRLQFKTAFELAPCFELVSPFWRERTAWPLGLNNEGHLLRA